MEQEEEEETAAAAEAEDAADEGSNNGADGREDRRAMAGKKGHFNLLVETINPLKSLDEILSK